MSTTTKWIIGILVAAIVGVAIGAVAFHSGNATAPSTKFGISNNYQVINYPEWETNGFAAGSQQQFVVNSLGQVTLGTSGTPITTLINGTCNASTAGLPLAATTTATFTCTVPGAVVGENVDVNLAANPTSWGAFTVVAPVTTAGGISFGILNGTGASTSSFPLATTSVAYTITK